MAIVNTTEPGYDLWQLLGLTYRLLTTANAKSLRKFKLTDINIAVLTLLSNTDHDPMPIELARAGKRSPQTVTAVIKRMEQLGLIKKYVDKEKKNCFRLTLTDKGRSTYQKITNVNLYSKIMSNLSEEKQQQLRECLTEIINAAGKYC